MNYHSGILYAIFGITHPICIYSVTVLFKGRISSIVTRYSQYMAVCSCERSLRPVSLASLSEDAPDATSEATSRLTRYLTICILTPD